jgi:hypothetical protein
VQIQFHADALSVISFEFVSLSFVRFDLFAVRVWIAGFTGIWNVVSAGIF